MSTQRVPLSQLLPPTSNPRRRIDPAGIEGLAASIRTDGMLQNLVVACLKGDRFRVVTGERRYRALKLLESRGAIGADYPVPVEVRHGLKPADARRIALVENVQREALDAIDEADGFAALLQKGATLDDVAAQTGLSTTTVKRRLALAGLCAEAKRAVRDGAIGLGIAEALTLGTHDQQRRILADVEDGGWYESDDVRARLIEEKPSVAMAVFPLERYSGTFTSDLFAEAEATYFDDAEQFHALQRQAVEELAAERARTAAFVDVFDTHGAPWWHYRAAQEGESGGVVINLTPSGRVEVRDGLVRHEVPHAVAAETRESPLAVRRERPEYPAWLVRHMAAHKTLAVQTLLIAARRTAKEVAVVLLMRGSDGHHGRVSVEAHPALALFAGGDDRPRSHDAIEAAAAYFERLLELEPDNDEAVYGPGSRGAWERLVGEPKDGADLYERVKRLSDEDLDGLHRLLTILAFGQGDMDAIDHGDSLFNRVARDLGADMRDWWRPDETFLGGRTRDQLGAIAVESGATAAMGRLADYKKTGLVTALAKHFERTAEAPDDAPDWQIRGRDWLPGAMRFGPEPEADTGDEPDSGLPAAAE
ncbi:ParB/RepB/Spo0J family partition protein [Azospirillum sp.]|uniref:ParB/RepB/Spo0J family partition protein n=1 Tax=Azospirillum sp. TaxID=34012 RepID=UPI002D72FD4B|nr:ParB/RepB/Spo0J family partition protein [Azospirillum sp.]HYD65129.1 ParB/RepB/Spo0J family partition protein [Azospirillum sp.]